MLVVAWDELYQAIPRIQAKEHLAAYTTAVLASPSLSEEGQQTRDSILENWRDLATKTNAWLRSQFQPANSFKGANTPPGAERDDAWFPSLHDFGNKMREVLGLGLRD
jgi:hypothetical protein